MANFSDFKDVLGKPYEGFHSKRINFLGLNLAYNDFIGSILIACIVGIIVGYLLFRSMKLYRLSFIKKIIFCLIILFYFIIITLIFGIILHRLFIVNTELYKKIFVEV